MTMRQITHASLFSGIGGAPHRRDRVWFVAHRTDTGVETVQSERKDGVFSIGAIADTNGERPFFRDDKETQGRCEQEKRLEALYSSPAWEKFPTQSPVCSRDDGLPDRLDAITFPKWRMESIKAYGNAWVPQVAYEIFRAINTLINREQR